MQVHHRITGLIVLAGLVLMPRPAHAETFNTCAGFIDSVPATISTQGVWCLRKDLATAINSGAAITIATNNVTIDCNHFKLGGLAAGTGTGATGISVISRLNATVRNCNVRGFALGASLIGVSGGGHAIKDNRFDANTRYGLWVEGDGSTVLRNQVNDTGGSTSFTGDAYAIYAAYSVDILDNTINGVLPSATGAGNGYAAGIHTTQNANGSISGNQVRGLTPLGAGTARGIYNNSSGRISLRGNDLSGDGSAGSFGLRCTNGQGRAKDNIVNGFVVGVLNCGDAGGNDISP